MRKVASAKPNTTVQDIIAMAYGNVFTEKDLKSKQLKVLNQMLREPFTIDVEEEVAIVGNNGYSFHCPLQDFESLFTVTNYYD